MASRNNPLAATTPEVTTDILELTNDLDVAQIPTDTHAAIEYLLAQLDPRKVKDGKVFPKVCMVHQIYGIVKDHTTVDRTLDQMLKKGTIRKFFLGGTGSDEFAIMFTTDYVQQIDGAKAQYLKDLSESGGSAQSGSKRKTPSSSDLTETGRMTKVQRITSDRAETRAVQSRSGQTSTPRASTPTNSNAFDNAEDTVFDRFKKLVTGGEHLEVMIQHSTLQHTINVSDADITILIRYGLLNRMLTIPANPHLVNMTKTSSRNTGGGGGGNTVASEKEASSLKAAHQTIATLRAGRTSSPSTSITGYASASPAMMSSDPVNGTSPSSSSSPLSSHSSKEGISVHAAGSRGEQVSDEIFYRFAIRQGGLFVSHFLKGRQEMLRTIKRKPFHDMLVSALKAKALKNSSLPHDFHILDLIGSARVRSMDTTSGQLLKITQKGENSARAGG
ncbi:Serine/threonine-protein kinase 19 [Actinomortierella wolfii]|nr:Serine/threonine-protein kinase 19 [Actinomortierella wolfii]